jgi:hypothetical protein
VGSLSLIFAAVLCGRLRAFTNVEGDEQHHATQA